MSISISLKSQYYYKDLISAWETSRTMKNYLTNKVHSVSSTGYDAQGIKTNDFSEQQDILQNGTILRTITTSDSVTTYLFSGFDDKARLINVKDSGTGLNSLTTYHYDDSGKIISIKNITKDTSDEINSTEIHLWYYNASGQPLKMLRILNDNDTTEYRFNPDEKGNIADEQSFRKAVAGEMTYYYYDDNNRMTDIVRYNEKAKKLLPDYMFEYDDNNRVIQKITTLSNLHIGYLIWRYVFDDKGLKTKEALFNKDKEMTGKIEYTYTFAQ